MFRRWSGSVCSLMVWTCLTACPGGDSGKTGGAPAAGSGGDADGGAVYDRDAGLAAVGGGTGGHGGSDGWNPAKDVKPAECRPDPTSFSACGGDVTGKWRIASLCFPSGIEELRELLSCPAIKQEFTYDYRMLVDFKSSGNYTAAIKSDAVQNVTVPKSCISEEADCSELGEDDTDDSDGETLTITSDLENCLIEAQIHDMDSVAGTWEVAGTKITMTDSDGPDTSDYCITGNTLVVRSENDITGEVSWGVFERP